MIGLVAIAAPDGFMRRQRGPKEPLRRLTDAATMPVTRSVLPAVTVSDVAPPAATPARVERG
jgi:hypothetical protein